VIAGGGYYDWSTTFPLFLLTLSDALLPSSSSSSHDKTKGPIAAVATRPTTTTTMSDNGKMVGKSAIEMGGIPQLTPWRRAPSITSPTGSFISARHTLGATCVILPYLSPATVPDTSFDGLMTPTMARLAKNKSPSSTSTNSSGSKDEDKDATTNNLDDDDDSEDSSETKRSSVLLGSLSSSSSLTTTASLCYAGGNLFLLFTCSRRLGMGRRGFCIPFFSLSLLHCGMYSNVQYRSSCTG
jgi:hypothetical protein